MDYVVVLAATASQSRLQHSNFFKQGYNHQNVEHRLRNMHPIIWKPHEVRNKGHLVWIRKHLFMF